MMAILNLEDHRIATPIPSIHLVRDYITPQEEDYLTRQVDHVGNSNAVVKPDLSIAVRAGGWQRVHGRRSMYWGGTMTPKGKLVPQSPPSFMTDAWPRVFRGLAELDIFASSSPAQGSRLPPNHCLVNEYNPGDGILPHLDGPAYLPTVATISLESDTVYEFYCYSERYQSLSAQLKEGLPSADRSSGTDGDGAKEAGGAAGGGSGRPIARQPLFSLFVPRRSLIVIRAQCYSELLHAIPARPADVLSPHLEQCLNWSDFSQYASQLTDLSLARGRRISLTCRRVERVVKGLDRLLK